MAFVRSKKTPAGKQYYQLVRNYRVRGVHRQHVLAHLGSHDSVEGAIEHYKQEIADLRAESATWLEEAERRKKYLLANHGGELDNTIPGYMEAYDTWRALENDLYRDYLRRWDTDQEVRLRWIKGWSRKWELYERILYYHQALNMAKAKEEEADAVDRRKLSELQLVQSVYC